MFYQIICLMKVMFATAMMMVVVVVRMMMEFSPVHLTRMTEKTVGKMKYLWSVAAFGIHPMVFALISLLVSLWK